MSRSIRWASARTSRITSGNMPDGNKVKAIEGGAEDRLEGVRKAPVAVTTPGREYVADANHFLNMRAQVYWQLRDDLAAGLVAIPRHQQSWRELLTRDLGRGSLQQYLTTHTGVAPRLGSFRWTRPPTHLASATVSFRRRIPSSYIPRPIGKSSRTRSSACCRMRLRKCARALGPDPPFVSSSSTTANHFFQDLGRRFLEQAWERG
jgi:hypothetical protein